MTRVLLVTGARSLADSRDAERWARALIAEALAGTDLLIVGDADGPDAWAWEEASRVLPRGTADARVYRTRGDNAGFIVGATTPTRWTPEGTSTHPLKRNTAMAGDAARCATEGHAVEAIALLDGRKEPKAPARCRFNTGATEVRTCETCGACAVFAEMLVAGHRWWHPGPHAAPCGAPCLYGGGLDALAPAAEISAHHAASHTFDHCGTANCRGGKLEAKRPTRGTEHTVRLARAAGLTVREERWAL